MTTNQNPIICMYIYSIKAPGVQHLPFFLFFLFCHTSENPDLFVFPPLFSESLNNIFFNGLPLFFSKHACFDPPSETVMPLYRYSHFCVKINTRPSGKNFDLG